MEKFDLLYSVLQDFKAAGVLDQVILIGSWCQDFYRQELVGSAQIPATRTTDADILIPKNLRLSELVDIPAIMRKHGFLKKVQNKTGVTKFEREDFKFEFLANAGAKPEEGPHEFKKLNIIAQELHFMSIPLGYNQKVPFRDLTINIPEPEAFALHKLIISQRRFNPEKKEKDIATAKGLFHYFEGKEKHIKRLNEILEGLPGSWRERVFKALEHSGVKIDYIKKKKAEDNKTIFKISITTKDLKKYLYDIVLNRKLVERFSKEQLKDHLNFKAQKIIKHDPKLKNEKIAKIKITPI